MKPWVCLKNDCKRFFAAKSLLLLISLLPVVLLLLLSYTMENVIGPSAAKSQTQQNLILYQIQPDTAKENQLAFLEYQSFMEEQSGGTLIFKPEKVAETAHTFVQQQKALGYITMDSQKVHYYRSPYNETDYGKRIRSTFENYFGKITAIESQKIAAKILPQKKMNSKEYFSFAALGFGILYIALVTSNLTYSEKKQKTILRLFLSKTNFASFVLGKAGLGLLLAAYQFLLVYLVAAFLLGVEFGGNLFGLFLLYLAFGAMTSLVGIFIGISSKTAELASGWVLMSSILTGLLGGGLIPLTALEGNGVVRFLTLFSPLRWLVKAAIDLSRHLLNVNLLFSLAISLGIAALFFGLSLAYVAKKKQKGVLIDV